MAIFALTLDTTKDVNTIAQNVFEKLDLNAPIDKPRDFKSRIQIEAARKQRQRKLDEVFERKTNILAQLNAVYEPNVGEINIRLKLD